MSRWRITWVQPYPEESLHSIELDSFSLRLGERLHSQLVPSSQLVSVERVPEAAEGVPEVHGTPTTPMLTTWVPRPATDADQTPEDA